MSDNIKVTQTSKCFNDLLSEREDSISSNTFSYSSEFTIESIGLGW